MARQKTIPVIDLFAGPGGLGEGFSSLKDKDGKKRFSLKASIEKDPVAHQTLSLRALYRAFPQGKVPESYYQYIRGEITREKLFQSRDIPASAKNAANEARLAELGKIDPDIVDSWISNALGNATDWVLIGGPPCQAYSLAGRSRRTREDITEFEKDEKHFLYKEYLRIIQRFSPAVFVMENVKGILSSKHEGSPIFTRILSDLRHPAENLSYEIRSFVVPGSGDELDQRDYVIESERFGIPQSRHRVILFGIRSDIAERTPALQQTPRKFIIRPSKSTVTVRHVLNDLPKLRSRLSKEKDTAEAWHGALHEASSKLDSWHSPLKDEVENLMQRSATTAATLKFSGGKFITSGRGEKCLMPRNLKAWYIDRKLRGTLQHETRSHMRSDLHRYIFAASYAAVCGQSPKLAQFPLQLLPAHGNVSDEDAPFSDRFRVQTSRNPSSTVVAHIAKDGHYFIHYDPIQCRSLTVREAARLQTFPDNYFFEGNRTQQYTQVGNAVPPLLAQKIATVVYNLLMASNPRRSRR
ncbi:TPA: DNA cytosine methyltransferase [Burkholderia cenocepacia]|uniref:DNA cytosine methyltransferase n=1 Tax=Burkholderia cenocepacia TaxID=95486 RepID=UPI001B9BF8F1|nr:DNA cytosine methyltransferase [Burkholderia cenocepacia]MBR8140310.1 DNA cytosine methyltransferase [Burkholderia cenocepacia]